jgi:hypothetical protein
VPAGDLDACGQRRKLDLLQHQPPIEDALKQLRLEFVMFRP